MVWAEVICSNHIQLGEHMITQVGKLCIEVEKETEINGKTRDLRYEFSMPAGAPIGETYDAAHEVLQEIVRMANEASDRAAREEKKNNKEEVEGN